MSLTNDERIQKIYFSIWRLTNRDTRRSLISGGHEELVALLDQLWPTFLKNSVNGLYWLLGSGVTDEVMAHPTLFNVALIGEKERHEPDELKVLDAEFEQELNARPESKEKQRALERRRRVKYQYDNQPSLTKILHRNVPALAAVYKACEECENIRYALNRYADEFATNLQHLDALVCRILGYCFHVFTTDPRVREAWYTFQIANRVMCQRVDPESTVVKFWQQGYLQHAVAIGLHDLGSLHKYWSDIQAKTVLTTEEAILATMWLLQRKFYSKHSYQQLVKLLKAHNRSHRKDKVSLVKVERMFRTHNLVAHKAYRRTQHHSAQYCLLSENMVERKWNLGDDDNS